MTVALSSLSRGDTGVVVSVGDDAASPAARRLADIGFVSGTRITVERRAPLGDPTVYVVRGSRIALRRAAARLVLVDRIELPVDPVGVVDAGSS